MRIEISDMAWDVSENRHVTWEHPKGDMGHGGF